MLLYPRPQDPFRAFHPPTETDGRYFLKLPTAWLSHTRFPSQSYFAKRSLVRPSFDHGKKRKASEMGIIIQLWHDDCLNLMKCIPAWSVKCCGKQKNDFFLRTFNRAPLRDGGCRPWTTRGSTRL